MPTHGINTLQGDHNVYSLTTLMVFSLLALIIGILLGALALRRFGGQSDLERRLQQSEQQFKDYQTDVTEHFAETSRRVNALTQSYREVHDYLASSAMKLTNPQMSQAISRAAQQNLPDASSPSELDADALDAGANDGLQTDKEEINA